MGSTVCGAVADDPDLELVAAVDPFHSGLDLRQATGVDILGLQVSSSPEAITRAGATVAVDFTTHDASSGTFAGARRTASMRSSARPGSAPPISTSCARSSRRATA